MGVESHLETYCNLSAQLHRLKYAAVGQETGHSYQHLSAQICVLFIAPSLSRLPVLLRLRRQISAQLRQERFIIEIAPGISAAQGEDGRAEYIIIFH